MLKKWYLVLQLQLCWVLYILPKIPEVLEVKWKGPFPFLPTGTFRTTSGCGPEYSGRNVPTEVDKPVHCPSSLHLCREFRKGRNKKGMSLRLSWPGLIGECPSNFLGYSHWFLTGWKSTLQLAQIQSRTDSRSARTVVSSPSSHEAVLSISPFCIQLQLSVLV